ncbi:DUF4278 domain-containing protein [Leptothermofonsia sichuanensis E412]|jgi:hypothetical protein|uniref:DUF4278 domain-containing protein n=1 Tax=Leptothermofonsia sichuanensis TaxID=2917832 RepID=UPI001CA687F9|nr:DUF4278 domain-containing protein [Leptothermofonsia sichuanensis]QZZ18937.1 DUF4278 domain-containing protein [Leptothermofonsia sichuanensis E412]
MKLIYRGVTYDYTPDQKTAPTEPQSRVSRERAAYRLQYRGTPYATEPQRRERRSIFHPIAHLMYRGASYSLES